MIRDKSFFFNLRKIFKNFKMQISWQINVWQWNYTQSWHNCGSYICGIVKIRQNRNKYMCAWHTFHVKSKILNVCAILINLIMTMSPNLVKVYQHTQCKMFVNIYCKIFIHSFTWTKVVGAAADQEDWFLFFTATHFSLLPFNCQNVSSFYQCIICAGDIG